MGTTKYILSEGDLKRKDNSLCFRKDGKNIYLPVENIKELYILNEVSLNSKLLDFFAQNNIVAHFFNYYGNYSGTFYPRLKYISGRLLIGQVNAYQSEKRLTIAKAFVQGILLNIYEVVYHYYKHEKKEVKPYLDYLKHELTMKISLAQNIPELMSYEGQMWQLFYYNFKYFIVEDFLINQRVKRPPDNPMNALISFGNSLLYAKTISVIYRTHLNQSISYLHEPSESRFSLSLDLCEPFKPVVVFKTIFDLVNNRKLRVEDHFNNEVNYCLLNEEGKKIFIQAFEERIDTKFKNGKLKRMVSYQTQMKLDCYKLIKCILENKEFKPFSLKDKK